MEWVFLLLVFICFAFGLANVKNDSTIATIVSGLLMIYCGLSFIFLRLNQPVGESVENNIPYTTSITESKVNIIYYKDGTVKVITKELDDPLGVLLANSYSNVFLVEEVVELQSGNFRTNSPTFKVKGPK